jgi:hypothetical protein
VFYELPELLTRAAREMAGGERPGRADRHFTQAELDATLEGSFPASDPPSWTAAIVRPAPERPLHTDGALRRLVRRVAACF